MKARILSPTPENLEIVAHALRNEDVVGMPTETVYGLAGLACSPQALARIFSTKERPTFDPLIIHVSPEAKTTQNLEDLHLIHGKAFSTELRSRVDFLIRRFWPGPLT